MKKYILTMAVLALVCGTASAQGLLGRLGERAKQAVENNIGNKIEQGINNALDGKKKDKNADKNAVPTVQQKEESAAADAANAMNNPMMKWFFPLFSIWICATSNAAFSIYWMAANVIQIVQQLAVNAWFDRQNAMKDAPNPPTNP